MEMTSENIEYALFVCSIFITVGLMGRMLLNWIDREIADEPKKPDSRDLCEAHVRADLTNFLRKNGVVGDADIRQGMVFAPVPPDRLEPLAVVLGNAAAFASRLRNPSANSIYIRDSLTDQFMLLGDLDLDHLADAARVMQRVAEDRRKSRSFYKGMTEDEIRALTRAGMSQWLKDDGSFAESNEVMQGLWDERPEFLMAMHVLDLTFKVKGASNG